MRLLETSEKYRAETEQEAKEMMEFFRQQADEKGFIIKKSGYEYKSKKSKGTIVDECWIVSCVKIHDEIWGE